MTNETPTRHRRGPPKGNTNALKTGLHTAEMKDLRRRLRAWRRRAAAVTAAGNDLARAQTDAEREQARAALLAAARGEGDPRKCAKTQKQFGRVD